jgi:hypothetical protein
VLNLGLFWLGLAGLALTSSGVKFRTISAALEVILRNICGVPLHMITDAKAARALTRQFQNGTGWIANLVLPLLAIVIFGTLLTLSNPLIANFVWLLNLNKPLEYLFSGSTPVALATFLMLWTALRMSPLTARLDAAMVWAQPIWHSRYFKLLPVIATLLILNAMFTVENALDYFYIWNGVKLPPGMPRVLLPDCNGSACRGLDNRNVSAGNDDRRLENRANSGLFVCRTEYPARGIFGHAHNGLCR